MDPKLEPVIRYILSLLLRGEEWINRITYAKTQDSTALVTIRASGFFDEDIYLTGKSIPKLPLADWHGIPLLFGEPREEIAEGRLIIHADIIASAFFLITRYEECVNRTKRDPHGRFLGKWSLPGKAGFLERPVVDEYGKALRECISTVGLKLPAATEGFSHIYLTHDVDEVWQWDNMYRAFRTFVKKTLYHKPDKMESFRAWFNYKKWDKIYTFPYFIGHYNELGKRIGTDRISEIYFIKCGGNTQYDNFYFHNKKRTKALIIYLQQNGALLGMHASYSAGENPQLVADEKAYLETLSGNTIHMNRNHYLDSREPEDMEYLIKAGIQDDFTLGYADLGGFRIGTCRPVRWINPLTQRLTTLVLHPMTVMECTLDGEEYMGLDYEDAYKTIRKLLMQVKQHNGEAVLLWHNNSVADDSGGYQRKLYDEVMKLLWKLT